MGNLWKSPNITENDRRFYFPIAWVIMGEYKKSINLTVKVVEK